MISNGRPATSNRAPGAVTSSVRVAISNVVVKDGQAVALEALAGVPVRRVVLLAARAAGLQEAQASAQNAAALAPLAAGAAVRVAHRVRLAAVAVPRDRHAVVPIQSSGR